MKSNYTPCPYAYTSIALLTNSVPLSTVIDPGAPRSTSACDNASATLWPVSELSAPAAQLARELVGHREHSKPAPVEQPGSDEIHTPLFVRSIGAKPLA